MFLTSRNDVRALVLIGCAVSALSCPECHVPKRCVSPFAWKNAMSITFRPLKGTSPVSSSDPTLSDHFARNMR